MLSSLIAAGKHENDFLLLWYIGSHLTRGRDTPPDTDTKTSSVGLSLTNSPYDHWILSLTRVILPAGLQRDQHLIGIRDQLCYASAGHKEQPRCRASN